MNASVEILSNKKIFKFCSNLLKRLEALFRSTNIVMALWGKIKGDILSQVTYTFILPIVQYYHTIWYTPVITMGSLLCTQVNNLYLKWLLGLITHFRLAWYVLHISSTQQCSMYALIVMLQLLLHYILCGLY